MKTEKKRKRKIEEKKYLVLHFKLLISKIIDSK